MNSTAAAPAPPGYHVDMQNPQVKGLELGLWVGFVGIGVSTAFLTLRVYTKVLLAKTFGFDDVCMLLAWVLAMGVQAMIICEKVGLRSLSAMLTRC